MKRYIFYCEQLTADEYNSLYQALDCYAFMVVPMHNRIIDVFWDNQGRLEDVIDIPQNCHYVCS